MVMMCMSVSVLHMTMIVVYRVAIILVMISFMLVAVKNHTLGVHMTIPGSCQVNRLSDSIVDRMCNSRSST